MEKYCYKVCFTVKFACTSKKVVYLIRQISTLSCLLSLWISSFYYFSVAIVTLLAQLNRGHSKFIKYKVDVHNKVSLAW